MSNDERRWGGDPRCTCPEVTFTSGPTAEQIEACRTRSPWLHQVITADDVSKMIAGLRLPAQ